MIILVSKYDHCLVDLLYRHKSGELACEIPLIISNHADNQAIADFYKIPYAIVPVTKDNKNQAEAKIQALIDEQKPDFMVLARYMQILSNDFVNRYPQRIINIHHSFLPAFVGARPYHQAFERGVKLIGATSHYVTEVLDDGPIIEQDVVRVSHRDTVEDLDPQGPRSGESSSLARCALACRESRARSTAIRRRVLRTRSSASGDTRPDCIATLPLLCAEESHVTSLTTHLLSVKYRSGGNLHRK